MAEEKEKQKNTEESIHENGIKVLLVDDDTFLLDMYSLKFKKSGCDVSIATSGADALKKIHEGYTPDIMVLDIIMPNMDGLELLENIRKEKLIEKALIIMLTNQADDNEKAKKFHIDGFIVKALHIPSEVVKQVLDVYNTKK